MRCRIGRKVPVSDCMNLFEVQHSSDTYWKLYHFVIGQVNSSMRSELQIYWFISLRRVVVRRKAILGFMENALFIDETRTPISKWTAYQYRASGRSIQLVVCVEDIPTAHRFVCKWSEKVRFAVVLQIEMHLWAKRFFKWSSMSAVCTQRTITSCSPFFSNCFLLFCSHKEKKTPNYVTHLVNNMQTRSGTILHHWARNTCETKKRSPKKNPFTEM